MQTLVLISNYTLYFTDKFRKIKIYGAGRFACWLFKSGRKTKAFLLLLSEAKPHLTLGVFMRVCNILRSGIFLATRFPYPATSPIGSSSIAHTRKPLRPLQFLSPNLQNSVKSLSNLATLRKNCITQSSAVRTVPLTGL